MEDLLQIYQVVEKMDEELEQETQVYLAKLRAFWRATPVVPAAAAAHAAGAPTGASPQQTKKRPKQLSMLKEADETIKYEYSNNKSRNNNTMAETKTEQMEEDVPEEPASILEPQKPPAPPVTEEFIKPLPVPAVDTHEFVRPQRAAKLKSEKNLKELPLNKKLRRPTHNESSLINTTVKKEQEQRMSQMLSTSVASTVSKLSSGSVKSADSSVLILPDKTPSVVDLVAVDSDLDDGEPKDRNQTAAATENLDAADNKAKEGRQLRVKIKREKISLMGDELGAEVPDKEVAKEVEGEKMPAKEVEGEKMPAVPMPKLIITKSEPAEGTSESVINSTSASTSTSTSQTKKSKKKKKAVLHVPIKVERFSDIDGNAAPIAMRTRSGSRSRDLAVAELQRSVYEDAVDQPANAEDKSKEANTETPPSRLSRVPKEVLAAANQTVTVSSANTELPNATMVLGAADATFTANAVHTTFAVPNEHAATFVMENPNATVTIATGKSGGAPAADATFNAAPDRRSPLTDSKDNQSMVTAHDTTHPQADSEESYKSPQAVLRPPKVVAAPKAAAAAASIKATNSGKTHKMPTRTNELFNPLVQSPVKKKVEAFEAAVLKQAKSCRPKRTKENALPTPTALSGNTPNIGKLPAPALGRFLTPTQSSNLTPSASTTMAAAKKLVNSASKAMPFPKAVTSLKSSASSSSLKSSASSSSSKPTLSRENSGDDFRRGLHQMAEERKKQREQKHLLAAQQRVAKEKERAERMAKLAKEREEKRLKKQAELEKKKAFEEIQRKLRQDEELEALKQAQAQSAKAKAMQEQERERELLQQMKPPKAKQFLQPMPKPRTKYTFEMLHEDDSTDEEDKVTYKRPPPPTWSRSNVRGPAIHMQQYWPTDIIDSFFSVQAMSPDLRLIFPNIDERYLKRNSSAFWSTPPRYSELPKY